MTAGWVMKPTTASRLSHHRVMRKSLKLSRALAGRERSTASLRAQGFDWVEGGGAAGREHAGRQGRRPN